MVDRHFIQEMVMKGEGVRNKVLAQLSGLTPAQLNWKPSVESWSIGQCLDHLVVTDSLYFKKLEKITAGSYHMNFWEKWNPLSGFFGKMLVGQVQEVPVKKLNAPKVFFPSTSSIDEGIYERFLKHLDSLLEYISRSAEIDIDRVIVTSPVSKVFTYSLRQAYRLLIQHAHRHINQAIRVRQHKEFPTV